MRGHPQVKGFDRNLRHVRVGREEDEWFLAKAGLLYLFMDGVVRRLRARVMDQRKGMEFGTEKHGG